MCLNSAVSRLAVGKKTCKRLNERKSRSKKPISHVSISLHGLNSVASYENEQVQQVDIFNRQTVTFIFFQHIFHIRLSIYPVYQQACECLINMG